MTARLCSFTAAEKCNGSPFEIEKSKSGKCAVVALSLLNKVQFGSFYPRVAFTLSPNRTVSSKGWGEHSLVEILLAGEAKVISAIGIMVASELIESVQTSSSSSLMSSKLFEKREFSSAINSSEASIEFLGWLSERCQTRASKMGRNSSLFFNWRVFRFLRVDPCHQKMLV